MWVVTERNHLVNLDRYAAVLPVQDRVNVGRWHLNARALGDPIEWETLCMGSWEKCRDMLGALYGALEHGQRCLFAIGSFRPEPIVEVKS